MGNTQCCGTSTNDNIQLQGMGLKSKKQLQSMPSNNFGNQISRFTEETTMCMPVCKPTEFNCNTNSIQPCSNVMGVDHIAEEESVNRRPNK